MGKSVMLAMSGGIDSSAAAVLLKNEGYEVHGLTFRIDGVSSSAIENAEKICKKLSISHEYIDITERFRSDVIEYFKLEYNEGRTPNPCIMCNKNIKFGYLYDIAMEKGFDYLATGHYATIKKESGRYYLEKASDETRDQSYFLYVLKERQLGKILFPLNGIPKDKARDICSSEGLMPRDSGESREICFVPDDYRKYLESDLHIKVKKGNFITKTGEIIGSHEGIHRYTLGQRKGLGLSVGKPVFITAIDEKTGNIILGDEVELYTKEIIVKNVNLINGTLPNNERFYVKIRYGSMDYEAAEIKMVQTDEILIELQKPAKAVTPGQSAVIYFDNRVVGGGTIKFTGGYDDREQ